jgi:Domain of unknown function (DUF3883)
MSGTDWSRHEVEAIIDDYLSMLASELSGAAYSKTAHRQALQPQLNGRSYQSIEYKHANISAALLEVGFPYINGYKPRSNYQSLLAEVVAERLSASPALLDIAAFDVDRPTVAPEVKDILAVLTDAPQSSVVAPKVRDKPVFQAKLSTNYLEREAQNRSLGSAGEEFVLDYECARLIRSGHEALAAKIEHTSKVRGDHEGYDILSFEDDGAERLIEVKTTKYGIQTPFFVTRNEVSVSERNALRYQVYRMFSFQQAPRLYTLRGSIPISCHLSAATFLAFPR